VHAVAFALIEARVQTVPQRRLNALRCGKL
jgi:hypothetical protein